MFNKNIFSERLVLLRSNKNVMAKDVACYLNISKQAVSQLEKGTTTPTANTLVTLADYFNVSLDYLVGRSDDPHRH